MNLSESLAAERFYGAKSEPIEDIETVRSAPAADFEWRVVDVAHGSSHDLYQLLLDDSADALSSERGAKAYLANAASFGEVHGSIKGTTAVPMGAEQSNTNLIVDDNWVLKVFRKLEAGLNPDVELLTQISDCEHVAGVRGYTTTQIDGQDYTLAMMQQRILGGTDGFDLALASPDFGDLSFELGQATRIVHQALAEAFPTQSVPVASVVDKLHAHLDDLLPLAPQLAELEPGIRALYDELSGDSVTVQRVHGDLHLGQTLRTADRWYLIDFEGEPARPLAQRVLPDHVLRDVAGMVRSFGYASAMSSHPEGWESENVTRYLEGYGEINAELLQAYVVDKAAYEVVYEANNRPDNVDIPLGAISKLIKR
ncbi:phosphotransferase [Corynebacterium lubricantis]|uniref:phosphotransferase n=1 Tax=Corynebacterium lubricantis TaxID=541095 RepID=UPI00036AF6C6|nr:phosphotransferase [Corynebacterium lubricantis]